jgi:hypothetical protein
MGSEKIALSFSLPSKETLRCPWTNRASATWVAKPLIPASVQQTRNQAGRPAVKAMPAPAMKRKGRHREMGFEESVEQSRCPVETSDGDVTALLPAGGSPRRIALP